MESSDSISLSCFLDCVNKGTDDCISDLPLMASSTDPPHDRCSNDDFSLYQCELCGKSFNKERQYLGHLGSHSKEKNWNCVLCNGSFATNLQLLKHMSKHEASLNAFQCSKCSLNFGSGNRLNAHVLAVHNNYRPFKCNECDKAFAKRSDLKHHQHVHLGLKKYPCEECGKEFSHASNLKRHKRQHSGLKPYVCCGCNVRYQQLTNLNRHKKNCQSCKKAGQAISEAPHSKETATRRHHCGQCGLTFLYLTELKNHRKRLHCKTKNLTDLGRTVDALIQDMLLDSNTNQVDDTNFTLEDSTPKQLLPDDSKNNDLNFSQMQFNSQNNHYNSDFFLINPYFNNFEPLSINNFESQTDTDYLNSYKQNDIIMDTSATAPAPIDTVHDFHLNSKDFLGANISFIAETNYDDIPNFDFTEDSCANYQSNEMNKSTIDSLNPPPLLRNDDSMTIFEKDVDLEEGTNLTTNLNQLIGDNNVQFIPAEDGDTFIIRLNSSIDAEQLSNMLNIKIEVVDVDDILNNVSEQNITKDSLGQMETVDESPYIIGTQNRTEVDVNHVAETVNSEINTNDVVKQNDNRNVFQNINVMRSENEIVKNEYSNNFTLLNKNINNTQNTKISITPPRSWISNVEFQKFLVSKNVIKNIDVTQNAKLTPNPNCITNNEKPKVVVTQNVSKTQIVSGPDHIDVDRKIDRKNENTKKLLGKVVDFNGTQNIKPNIQTTSDNFKVADVQSTPKVMQNIHVKQKENPIFVIRDESRNILVRRKVVKNVDVAQNESKQIVVRRIENTNVKVGNENGIINFLTLRNNNKKSNDSKNTNLNMKVTQSNSPFINVLQYDDKVDENITITQNNIQNIVQTQNMKLNNKVTRDEKKKMTVTKKVSKSINGLQNINTNSRNIYTTHNVYKDFNGTSDTDEKPRPKVNTAESDSSGIFVPQSKVTNINEVKKVLNRINLSLSSKKKVRQTIKEKATNSFTCEVCSKVFARKDNYQSHLGIHNAKLRKFKCRICQAKFSWQSTLARHMLAAHSKGKARYSRCTLCTKTYQYPCQLKEHMERDHEKKFIFECGEPGCMRRFYRKYDLNLHMNVHKQTKTYACRRCSMTFVHSSNKIRHELACLLRRYRTAVATPTQTYGQASIPTLPEKQKVRATIDWCTEPTTKRTLTQINKQDADTCKMTKESNDSRAKLKTNKQDTRSPNMAVLTETTKCIDTKTNVQTYEQNIGSSDVKFCRETNKLSNIRTNIYTKKQDVQEPDTESCIKTNELSNKLDVKLPSIQTNKTINKNNRPIILSNVRIKIPFAFPPDTLTKIKSKIQPLVHETTWLDKNPDIQHEIETKIRPYKASVQSSCRNTCSTIKSDRQTDIQNSIKQIQNIHSSLHPVLYSNIKTDLQSDNHINSQSDIHTNLRSEMHSNSRADLLYDVHTDKQSDLHINLHSEIHCNKQPDMSNKVHINLQSDMHIDIQSDKQYDMQSNLQSKMQSDTLNEVNINKQPDIQSDMQYAIQSDICTNLQPEKQSDKRAHLFNEVHTDIQSDTPEELQNVLHFDMQNDINAHLLSEIQNDIHTNILSEFSSELQSELPDEMSYSNMQDDAPSDIEHNIHTDVLSKLQSEIRSDRQSEITYSNMQEGTQPDLEQDIHTKLLSELQSDSDIQSDLQRALAEMPDSPLDSSYSSRQLLSDIDDLLKNKML